MKFFFYILLISSLSISYGQGRYAPAAGVSGSTAIHKDSSVFVSWGSSCSVSRGYQQIDSTHFGLASNGDSTNAIGMADGVTVSLGDSGIATYSLYRSVFNGVGADFAVFENGFSANFLELAFVEVSSDGVNYFRFPSFSYTQDSIQIGTFGNIQPTYIHNLAGKYQVNYGTPFDLDDIPNNSLLNKRSITHIKIIDVIGNILPGIISFDSQNNKINDPWPTPFPSSGFDLDAIGFIHINGINSLEENRKQISIYPNPFTEKINIEIEEEMFSIQLVSLHGKITELNPSKSLDLSYINNGIYFLKINTKTNSYVQKVVKN